MASGNLRGSRSAVAYSAAGRFSVASTALRGAVEPRHGLA